jgi:penicillin-binding protein 1A
MVRPDGTGEPTQEELDRAFPPPRPQRPRQPEQRSAPPSESTQPRPYTT